MTFRLLLAAGGTGGHVFPAVAIARAARRYDPQVEILFVGTPKGFENQLVPKEGFRLELIEAEGLKGKNVFARLRSLAVLPAALIQSWKIISHFSPTAVFGIGGYASGPIMILAALRGIKTAILEPNAEPGFSNRLLSHFVKRVYVAFDVAKGKLPLKKCVVTGNPIREEILRVPPPNFQNEKRTILVFGGSQGARRINESVMAMLYLLHEYKDRFTFIHQTGIHDFARVKKAYADMGVEASVREFIDDMADAYRKCDLVIARSGASVLEVAACGRPSILIPFPYAADDHQMANAEILKSFGAAVVIPDSECNGESLGRALLDIILSTERLKKMSVAALHLRQQDAADIIARELAA